jgi:hypothetical protein
MMRARSGLSVMLVGASLSLIGCGGSTPRDMYFGKDAGADFTPPDLATPVDATGAAGAAGSSAGASGAGGDTSGAAGAGGAAGADATSDAGDGAVSDGAAG